MNTQILELIKVVDSNYDHIQQLETLTALLDKAGYENEHIVAKTTHNSHYNYKLYTAKCYTYPENHIDTFLNQTWLKQGQIVCIDKEIVNSAHDVCYQADVCASSVI